MKLKWLVTWFGFLALGEDLLSHLIKFACIYYLSYYVLHIYNQFLDKEKVLPFKVIRDVQRLNNGTSTNIWSWTGRVLKSQ